MIHWCVFLSPDEIFMMRKFFLFGGLIILLGSNVFGQSWLDFRTSGSGDWDNLSNWEQYTWRWPFSFSWTPANRLPDSYSGRIISNVNIQSGHTISLNRSVAGTSGSLNINGTLLVTGAISGLTNTENFPRVNISGTLSISSYLNTTNLFLNSTGIINTSFSGTDQSRGLWYNSTVPSTADLSGTFVWSASVPQVISTFSSYNNLVIASNSSTYSGNLNVDGELRINNNSSLTISQNTNATVNDLNIIPADGALILESDASGTASLIHTGSITGSDIINIQRYTPANAWHLISVPLSEYNLSSLLAENNIDQNGSGEFYALRTLNETTGIWTLHPTNPIPNYDLSPGEGFFTGISEGNMLQFTGKINPDQNILCPVTNNNRGWNASGNPFTSAMGITIFSDAGDNCFLSRNASLIDQNDLAVYVYDPVINNYIANSSSVGEDYIQTGQGFIVRAGGSGGNLVFNSMMQSHNDVAFYKKSIDKKALPGITLTATFNELSSQTKLIYHEDMTYGLDPSWDIRGFGHNENFHFYSHLVQNGELSYFVQCLPDRKEESIIVPLGLDFTMGGKVKFSAEFHNLSLSSGAYLEDREKGIITDLREPGAVYEVNLAPGTKGTGRFYFHENIDQTSGFAMNDIEKIKIYSNQKQVFLKGRIPENSHLTIYDISGRIVSKKQIPSTNLFQINLDNLKDGVYLLFFESETYSETQKIILY